jgi:isoleucyl-tRNA synthetase
MGLDHFARACRERVERFAALQTAQSERLGQWMDWEHSYFTMADRNIEYIWHFLAECE